MDTGIIISIVATGLTVMATVYAFLRNFKSDIEKKFDEKFLSMEKRIDLQDERMFLLATGKTFREAMVEAKKNSEEKKQ